MSALRRYLPHRVDLPEDHEIESPSEQSLENEDTSKDKQSVEIKSREIGSTATNSGLQSSVLAILETNEGESYDIKEFRDEASRKWWGFFNEYEYRETTEESAHYKWYSWFRTGASKNEKSLLWKLDLLITFYAFVGFWMKFLDQSNLNNAYVSNMKEDLGMKGNDLVNVQVIYLAGYAIILPFWIFILPTVPLNYALFTCEISWTILTFATGVVKNVPALRVVRLFMGIFEASYFPCISYTMSSWYLPSEVSRRGGFFFAGQYLGTLTAGLLQAAVFDSLDGKDGRAGWRWMFFIDGAISIVVAFMALFCLPGTPFNCYSLFLSKDEIRLARERIAQNGGDSSLSTKGIFKKSKWKKAFSTWHVYLLTLANIFGYNTNSSSSGSFALWLKSLDKYSIGKLDNLSTIPPALGIVYIAIISLGADVTRKRFLFVILSYFLNFAGNFPLALWDVPYSAKWFGFCSTYWAWSQMGVLYPLVADFFRADNDIRSICWTIIYLIPLAFYVWLSRVIWPTVESPRFHKGFSTCAYFGLVFNFFFSFAYYLYKRDERTGALSKGIFVYNSEKESLDDSLKAYKVTYL